MTIFRLQNVYGPGQSLNNAYTGILSIFTQLLMASTGNQSLRGRQADAATSCLSTMWPNTIVRALLTDAHGVQE